MYEYIIIIHIYWHWHKSWQHTFMKTSSRSCMPCFNPPLPYFHILLLISMLIPRSNMTRRSQIYQRHQAWSSMRALERECASRKSLHKMLALSSRQSIVKHYGTYRAHALVSKRWKRQILAEINRTTHFDRPSNVAARGYPSGSRESPLSRIDSMCFFQHCAAVEEWCLRHEASISLCVLNPPKVAARHDSVPKCSEAKPSPSPYSPPLVA